MTGRQIAAIRREEPCAACRAAPGQDCCCGPAGVHLLRVHAAFKHKRIEKADFAGCLGGVVTRFTVISPEGGPS